MGAPVSEVAIIPLVKGADPRVENSEAAKTLNRSIQHTLVQPGYQRMVWGLDKNDPTVMIMIVDWDDLQSHLNFMTAPHYQSFMNDFNTIVAGAVTLFHTTYEEGVGIMPLVELNDYMADVYFAFFPARSLTQDFQDDFSRVSRTVNTDLLGSNDTSLSIASGWCIDDTLDEERPGKGPERPWMSIVTWKNAEIRQRAWDRNAVLGGIPQLVEGKGELEIYEVEFQPSNQGPLKDDFGEYTIVAQKLFSSMSPRKSWYCKHQYDREGENECYHYVHLDGRYYSKNPDGSIETINPILKEAFYTLPGTIPGGERIPIDYSDEVDWESLSEIPDPCIARASEIDERLGEFMQEIQRHAETTVANDQCKRLKNWEKMLEGKENSDMVTENEAEETENESEHESEDETENHTEDETGEVSIGEPMNPEETEGRSLENRKANEMDGSEDETIRTPPPNRGNMNKRREPMRTEQDANKRKRERRRNAKRAKQGMEERTSES
ncbi:Dimeric alpha-beta barrel [Penicillium griseofulvum]|uniref:Dimeric alpha-beta barrel n=1 Tax=Penicillium patulum TaxID=5078 RepID=A0A135L9E3_PENPA|nr:Dimeric alpha-beta barrel [Penicillium griseofulvum]KXG45582.1 Dimeric alpha-beta barrel [Penicillium griseofulvum]